MWDGEGAVGRWRGKRMELTQACQEFRGTLAAKVQICKPADPEAKGLVERFHDYLERSFLPGRTFASPADFNNQLCGFLERANRRRHRVLGLPAGSIGSMVTGRRCCRCRRCRRSPAGGHRPGCRGTTTCGWTATTTPCTRPRSAAGSLHADLDRVRVWCEGGLSLTIPGSGPNIKV